MKVAMRCAKCEQMAAIRMRHHRLSFCREHYLEWFVHQTADTIQKFRMFPPTVRVLVAVSGGKDSLSLWDVLWRLGYNADGLFINLGIQGKEDYSNNSESYAQSFAAERQLALRVVNLAAEYRHAIPELARASLRGITRPCAVCGLVKRHIMNQAAVEGKYDSLVTGHNLDDEVAVLFGNTLSWQVELLQRQAPVLEAATGFTRKAKPFCRFYERETTAYAILRGIAYIEDECPFSQGSKQLEYKEILNRLEVVHPGMKMNFYASFNHARKNGTFAVPQTGEVDPQRTCSTCGQLTTRHGQCAFCQLFVDPNRTPTSILANPTN